MYEESQYPPPPQRPNSSSDYREDHLYDASIQSDDRVKQGGCSRRDNKENPSATQTPRASSPQPLLTQGGTREATVGFKNRL